MASDHPVVEVFKSLPLAFYSSAFYRRAVREWQGIGAGFILIVTAFSIILSGAIIYAHKAMPGMQMEKLLAQLPEATVKDHRLSIDAPNPFILKLIDTPQDGTPQNLVIDTDFTSTDTAEIGDYLKKHDAFFLITASKLIFATRDGIQVNTLKLPDRRYTREDYREYGRIIDTWFYPLSIVFMSIVLTIVNFIVAAIGGGIALLLGLVAREKLDYAAAMRLAACAAVPATVIAEPLQFSFAVKAIIWFGYAIFGVLALKRIKPADPVIS